MLFQEEIDVVAFDVFQHRAESTRERKRDQTEKEVQSILRICVDLEDIE